ncbi:tetratricopeptide repeat protein [Nonomuraea rubra]
MPDPAPLQPGDPRSLGDITLRGRLSTSEYLGVTASGETVSVRVVPSGSDAFRGIARDLHHLPGIGVAPVVGTGEDGGLEYLAARHVEGPTLHETVSLHGPLSGEDLRRLAAGIAIGLRTIHGAGVVHRALTPHAVVLSEDGPVVTDLGLAASAAAAAVTSTGSLAGTMEVPCLAPEQVRGEHVGPAADVFAWGSIVAFAASGEYPFGSEPLPAVLHRILSGEPELRHLPEPLRDLVKRALARHPAERPTAGGLVLELMGQEGPPQQGQGQAPPSYGPPSYGPPSARPASPPYPAQPPEPYPYPPYPPYPPQPYPYQQSPPAYGYQGSVPLPVSPSISWAAARSDRPRRLVPSLLTDAVVVSLALVVAAILRWFGPSSTAVLVVALGTATAAGLGRIWLNRPASVARWAARRGRRLLDQGRPDAALDAWSLAADHATGRRRLIARANLALAHREQGNLGEAHWVLDGLLPHLTAAFGATHPEVLTARADLAAVLRDLGQAEQAAAELLEVADLTERALGADHPQTLRARANQAVALDDAGDPEGALRLLRDLLPRVERVLGRRHRDVLAIQANAAAIEEPGRTAESLRLVLGRQRRELGPGHPDTLRTSTNLGYVLLRDGDQEAALALFDEVAGLAGDTLGRGHPLERRAREGAASARGGER